LERWEQRGVPWTRGVKISVSFSCPSELLTKIEQYKLEERANMSKAICQLVRLGLVYSQLLLEQAAIKAEEKAKPRKKKKGKPNTPSK
jgi:hypothetical protein